jgi:hypothetical protein
VREAIQSVLRTHWQDVPPSLALAAAAVAPNIVSATPIFGGTTNPHQSRRLSFYFFLL